MFVSSGRTTHFQVVGDFQDEFRVAVPVLGHVSRFHRVPAEHVFRTHDELVPRGHVHHGVRLRFLLPSPAPLRSQTLAGNRSWVSSIPPRGLEREKTLSFVPATRPRGESGSPVRRGGGDVSPPSARFVPLPLLAGGGGWVRGVSIPGGFERLPSSSITSCSSHRSTSISRRIDDADDVDDGVSAGAREPWRREGRQFLRNRTRGRRARRPAGFLREATGHGVLGSHRPLVRRRRWSTSADRQARRTRRTGVACGLGPSYLWQPPRHVLLRRHGRRVARSRTFPLGQSASVRVREDDVT